MLALVTGASSGIGRALALEFCRHGYDLVVIARDLTALQELELECGRERPGARVVPLSFDLTRREAPREIEAALRTRELAVDVLVNNAGYGVHGAFAETDLTQELGLVEIQISALLQLTKIFLPGMLQRGRGGILNVASVYSFSPVPHQAVYGATKAFMLSFSEAIRNEIDGRGVTVTTLCPGVTRTEFRKRAGMRDKKSTSGLSSEEVAQAGYAAFAAHSAISVPGGVNKFFVNAARLIPRSWVSPAIRKINQIRGVAPKA